MEQEITEDTMLAEELEEVVEVEEQPESGKEAKTEDLDTAITEGEAEEPTYNQEQWGGLLRDKQNETTARQQAQAEAAAHKALNEQLKQQLAEQSAPKEPQLSEDEAAEPVTRAELLNFGKSIAENIGKQLESQKATEKTQDIKQQQQTDAKNLQQTHTVKAKGPGLDAAAVLNEGTAYLQQNNPEMLKAAMKSPNFASQLYDLCLTFVPEIRKRNELRQKTLLAAQLNLNPKPPGGGVGGGGAPGGDSDDVLFGIIDGTISETDVDKMFAQDGT